VPEHEADLLLATHEHGDHNAVEVVTGMSRGSVNLPDALHMAPADARG
jgi:L-ascorbate metabolism protein UlaG (beta-lactamase superfamily)